MTTDDILGLENQPDNRREYERTAFTVEIAFDGGNATGTATTRDVGLGGLYMSTTADLREGTPLSLRMRFGDKELKLNGTVVYRDPGQGVGVRFNGLDEEAENMLLRSLPLT